MTEFHLPESWRGYTMREAAHYNGGQAFFAYLMRCVQQPRLSRYDRYERKTRSVTSTWKVDGADCATITDAVNALAVPPVFTSEESATLGRISDEWIDLRKIEDFHVLDSLTNKGAIEWKLGKCRLLCHETPKP